MDENQASDRRMGSRAQGGSRRVAASCLAWILLIAGCGSGAFANAAATVIDVPPPGEAPRPWQVRPIRPDDTEQRRAELRRLQQVHLCLGRANEIMTQASTHIRWDETLVIIGTVFGGIGAVFSAIAGILAAPPTGDDDISQAFFAVGVGGLATSSMFLALHAALDFGDLARRERESAVAMTVSAFETLDGPPPPPAPAGAVSGQAGASATDDLDPYAECAQHDIEVAQFGRPSREEIRRTIQQALEDIR